MHGYGYKLLTENIFQNGTRKSKQNAELLIIKFDNAPKTVTNLHIPKIINSITSMHTSIYIFYIFVATTVHYGVSGQEKQRGFTISIPTAGNSWILSDTGYKSSNMLTEDGIFDWTNQKETIRTFFYMETPGEIVLGLRAKVAALTSEIQIQFEGQSKNLILSGSAFSDVPMGKFTVQEAGYHYIDIKGLKKAGNTFANITALLIRTQTPESFSYVKDDFYFGRRGPSDHLNYEIPEGVDSVAWFYSELRIPDHQDVEGSYFMANGFAEGYFGIQVNSPTERRILFSIWSPYETDNPAEIPEEDRIILLKKGENVQTNDFGDEGSGGQSFKVFSWKTNINYGFLVGATPSTNGYTDFVAYFFDPIRNEWNLIAQFRRPKTTTYLKGLYSFLENFIPDQGVIERKGMYQNQWVYDSLGWHEITKAVFTADNTARKGYRLDYSGGNEGAGFYLRNCGFSNDHTPIGSLFQRKQLNRAPNIHFTALE